PSRPPRRPSPGPVLSFCSMGSYTCQDAVIVPHFCPLLLEWSSGKYRYTVSPLTEGGGKFGPNCPGSLPWMRPLRRCHSLTASFMQVLTSSSRSCPGGSSTSISTLILTRLRRFRPIVLSPGIEGTRCVARQIAWGRSTRSPARVAAVTCRHIHTRRGPRQVHQLVRRGRVRPGARRRFQSIRGFLAVDDQVTRAARLSAARSVRTLREGTVCLCDRSAAARVAFRLCLRRYNQCRGTCSVENPVFPASFCQLTLSNWGGHAEQIADSSGTPRSGGGERDLDGLRASLSSQEVPPPATARLLGPQDLPQDRLPWGRRTCGAPLRPA